MTSEMTAIKKTKMIQPRFHFQDVKFSKNEFIKNFRILTKFISKVRGEPKRYHFVLNEQIMQSSANWSYKIVVIIVFPPTVLNLKLHKNTTVPKFQPVFTQVTLCPGK